MYRSHHDSCLWRCLSPFFFLAAGPLAITQDDIEYLLELWRNRCGVTGDRLGVVLCLARWDEQRPGTCDNLVLVSANFLKRFDQVDGKEQIPVTIQQRIQERMAQCRLD
jgi:hypothetical protein